MRLLRSAYFLLLCASSVCQTPLKVAVPIKIDSTPATGVSQFVLKEINGKEANSVASLEKILSALSQKSEAEVLKQRTTSFFGMPFPMEVAQEEEGLTIFVVLLLAQHSSSPMTRELNPWPMWQIQCAKVFQESPGKYNLASMSRPERKTDIPPHALSVKMASEAAVKWLRAKEDNAQLTLSGVLSAEKQALEIKHMERMDLHDESKTKWGVEVEMIVYYISLLLHNGAAAGGSRQQHPTFPDESHMFAVSESKAGGEMVVRAHFAVDSPGNAMVTATFAMAGFLQSEVVCGSTNINTNSNNNRDNQLGCDPAASKNLAAIRAGLVAVAKQSGSGGAGLHSADAVEVVSVDQQSDVTLLTFVIGVAGSGTPLMRLMKGPQFIAHLITAVNQAGFSACKATAPLDLEHQHQRQQQRCQISAKADLAIARIKRIATSTSAQVPCAAGVGGGSSGGGAAAAAQRLGPSTAAIAPGMPGGSASGGPGGSTMLLMLGSVVTGLGLAWLGVHHYPEQLDEYGLLPPGLGGGGGGGAGASGYRKNPDFSSSSSYQQVDTSTAEDITGI